MSIEDLKKNILREKKIIEDLTLILNKMNSSKDKEKKNLEKSIISLMYQLRTLNNSVPFLLNDITPIKELPSTEKKQTPVSKTERFSYYPSGKNNPLMAMNKEDKKRFVKELKFSENSMNEMNRKEEKIVKTSVGFGSSLAGISNKLFSGVSEKISAQFKDVGEDLRKANIRFLLSTYISIALFVSLAVLILSLIGFSVFLILNFSLIKYIWIPFGLFFLSLVGFYFYPASEKGSVQKAISYELPFATIHMSAIAGADIEPTKIFKIIATSSEYPNVGKEIQKVNNQVEIYGYDLVTALKNVSKQTSNKQLADLFTGLATNISTGGELKNYLDKKSENFLMDYKLERMNYSELAGTFMDIYISILIAAPLVLMMMFIVMGITGMGPKFLTTQMLMILSVGLVAVVNIIFIVVLQIKQPKV